MKKKNRLIRGEKKKRKTGKSSSKIRQGLVTSTRLARVLDLQAHAAAVFNTWIVMYFSVCELHVEDQTVSCMARLHSIPRAECNLAPQD